MAEMNPPAYEANGCITAQGDRLVWSSLICTPGVSGRTNGSLLVTSGDGLSVTIAKGSAFIRGDQVPDQGMYHVFNDGPVTLPLAASNPTDGRVDAVVATVRDSQYSGTANNWVLQVITGNPSPAPSAPMIPVNSILLATIAVAAGATGSNGMTITDRRVQAELCPGFANPNIYAVAYRNAAQSIPNNTVVNVAWDGTGPVSGGATVTSAGIRVPRAGVYDVAALGNITNSGTTGFLQVDVVLASGKIAVSRAPLSPNGPTVGGASTLVTLAADEVVTVSLYHTNGATRDTFATSQYVPRLSVRWIAPA